eukprot:gene24086-9660_t
MDEPEISGMNRLSEAGYGSERATWTTPHYSEARPPPTWDMMLPRTFVVSALLAAILMASTAFAAKKSIFVPADGRVLPKIDRFTISSDANNFHIDIIPMDAPEGFQSFPSATYVAGEPAVTCLSPAFEVTHDGIVYEVGLVSPMAIISFPSFQISNRNNLPFIRSCGCNDTCDANIDACSAQLDNLDVCEDVVGDRCTIDEDTSPIMCKVFGDNVYVEILPGGMVATYFYILPPMVPRDFPILTDNYGLRDYRDWGSPDAACWTWWMGKGMPEKTNHAFEEAMCHIDQHDKQDCYEFVKAW